MEDENPKNMMSYAARKLEEFFEDFIKVNKGELLKPENSPTREEKTFKIGDDAWVCYRILHTPEREEKVGDKTVTIPEVTFGKEIEIKKGKEFYQLTHTFDLESYDINSIYAAIYFGADRVTVLKHFAIDNSLEEEIKELYPKEIDAKLEEACKKFGVNWPYKSEPDYAI